MFEPSQRFRESPLQARLLAAIQFQTMSMAIQWRSIFTQPSGKTSSVTRSRGYSRGIGVVTLTNSQSFIINPPDTTMTTVATPVPHIPFVFYELNQISQLGT